MSPVTDQLKTKPRVLRLALRIVTAVAVVYAILVAVLFIAMKQTPTQFGSVMAKLPAISMSLLPFESLWAIARAGVLEAGDPAPDFRLPTRDKSAVVQLSSFRGDRPVVLIFGSYT
jgi:hypothetical protein